MTKLVYFTVVCAACLAVAGTAAVALEEQRAPQVQDGAAPSALHDPATQGKADSGTEIRIPGLGKLGTLPKMDFGLELLYGAADGKEQEAQPPVESTPEDLTIRGSVNHRF